MANRPSLAGFAAGIAVAGSLAAPGVTGALGTGAGARADACGLPTPAFTAAVRTRVTGRVLSGSLPVASTPIALYRTAGRRPPVLLGRAVTRGDGSFEIAYRRLRPSRDVLYLLTGRARAVRLAAVLGVRESYVRRLLERGQQIADGGHDASADRPGDQVLPGAYLAGNKDDRGRWQVARAELDR